MANRVKVTILEEGWRNVRVSVAAHLDTANLSAQTVLTLANCVNNDPTARGTLRAFAVEKIQYNGSSPLLTILDWHATANQLIAGLVDSGELCYSRSSGLHPADTTAAGFNGTVELSTAGFATANAFTLLIDFLKVYK